MDKSQRRSGDRRGPAEGRGFLRRLHDLLEEGLGGPRLIPVPIPTGAYRPRPNPPIELRVHRVFGRRKDEDRGREDTGADESSTEEPAPAVESAADLGAEEFEQPESDLTGVGGPDQTAAAAEESLTEPAFAQDQGEAPPAADPWSSPAMADPFSYQPSADAPELPAWTPSPLMGAGFPSFETPPTPAEAESSPWAGGFGEAKEASSPAEYSGADAETGGWPASPTESEEQPWSAAGGADEAAAAAGPTLEEEPFEAIAAPDDRGQGDYSQPLLEQAGDEEVSREGPAETAQEETGDLQPFEPDQLPEVVAVSETAWEVSSLGGDYQMASEPVVSEPVVSEPGGALVEGARTFPLPEGELLFRNLSVGFTDPARLLRHLAGEGHTGVMHVASQDGRNTYIVLVEGYVVAVASDSQGRLSTSSRVSFPAFPNSQDIITVISYSAEIARGLGLLLHAPVHFSGLGAMFVDLDGLRSFLSKRSASGGLVVESATGTGVALFDEGRLVGAYSGESVPAEDLAPLRELIKDLDAEIDVRFGGPHQLEPIPLETLLAGYPL
jgi:hypothetical protein